MIPGVGMFVHQESGSVRLFQSPMFSCVLLRTAAEDDPIGKGDTWSESALP